MRSGRVERKTTYLTVDLDYWDVAEKPSVASIVQKVLKLNIPVSLFLDHHLVLRDFSGGNTEFLKLINVDQHDDLAGDTTEELNEANWVNYVPFRNHAVYEWRFPIEDFWCCDGQDGDLTWNQDGYFTEHRDVVSWNRKVKSVCGWKEIRRIAGLGKINYREIGKASFVLSPAYVSVGKIHPALMLLAEAKGDVGCSNYVKSALSRLLNGSPSLFKRSLLYRRKRADHYCKRGKGQNWASQ
jgi:hypothetical protein